MTTNKNEPDKTKTKVSRLNDPDANPLWLSTATYDDPKHHVIRRVFVNKSNAYKPCILRDPEKRKDYKPIKNEVYELDFHLGDLNSFVRTTLLLRRKNSSNVFPSLSTN